MVVLDGHLVPALLQQSLHKLPVGVSDDGGGQIGQFGLADCGAQVPGLLDVLLMTEVERARQHRKMINRNKYFKKY